MPQPITAARPAAPRDGLAGAVGLGVIIPDDDPLDPQRRWSAGAVPEGPACTGTYIIDHVCSDESPAYPGDQSTRRVIVGDESQAVRIGAAVECSTFGGSVDVAGFNADALAMLDRTFWPSFAYELWTGSISSDHQRLASPDAVTLTTGPVSPVAAVGLLESAIGGCQVGEPDLLHVPRSAVSAMSASGLLVEPTSVPAARQFTYNGSLVIADRGYPGTGPNGEAPTSTIQWWYATGIISARRGDPVFLARDLEAAVDHRTNDTLVRVEVPAVASWLCCHYAVEVDLSLAANGGGAGVSDPEGLVL